MSEANKKFHRKLKENNVPSLTDEVTLALRAITEKRASTIAYVVDEAKKENLSDSFLRRAIRTYGEDNGVAMRDSMNDPTDLKEFAKLFNSGLESRVYEMETILATNDEFRVHFHYCPYVNRWLSQERTQEEMGSLCEACMEGDDSMTNAFDGLKFELGNTIAKGGEVCELTYRK